MTEDEKILVSGHRLVWYADFQLGCDLWKDSYLIIQQTLGKWTIQLACPFGAFGRAWDLKK
jgi:hypothetical protein